MTFPTPERSALGNPSSKVELQAHGETKWQQGWANCLAGVNEQQSFSGLYPLKIKP